MRRAPLIVAACLALVADGCSTLCYFGVPRCHPNWLDEAAVLGAIYCGTSIDLQAVGGALPARPEAQGAPDPPWVRRSRWLRRVTFGALDLPLSLTFDTLLLPLTVPLQVGWWLTHD